MQAEDNTNDRKRERKTNGKERKKQTKVNTDSAYKMKRYIILVSQVMSSNSHLEVLAGAIYGNTSFCGASHSLEANPSKLASASYFPHLFSFTNHFPATTM
jgi:hypothetical protein